MKKKLNSEKIRLETNSLNSNLFKKLTDQELKEIRGGNSQNKDSVLGGFQLGGFLRDTSR